MDGGRQGERESRRSPRVRLKTVEEAKVWHVINAELCLLPLRHLTIHTYYSIDLINSSAPAYSSGTASGRHPGFSHKTIKPCLSGPWLPGYALHLVLTIT